MESCPEAGSLPPALPDGPAGRPAPLLPEVPPSGGIRDRPPGGRSRCCRRPSGHRAGTRTVWCWSRDPPPRGAVPCRPVVSDPCPGRPPHRFSPVTPRISTPSESFGRDPAQVGRRWHHRAGRHGRSRPRGRRFLPPGDRGFGPAGTTHAAARRLPLPRHGTGSSATPRPPERAVRTKSARRPRRPQAPGSCSLRGLRSIHSPDISPDLRNAYKFDTQKVGSIRYCVMQV